MVANNVFITNGILGLSSHHGIHANLCKNIIINNLRIEDFAVGAIHLNGGHNIIVNNIVADNSNINIKINSLFSQAQFILELLEDSDLEDDSFITINNTNKSIGLIKNNLKTDTEEVITCIKNNQSYPSHKIFHNEGGKLDANIYGMVFNTKGVAVKGFKNMRENNDCGNSNIVINNVCIKNIESKGTEIKVLTDESSMNDDGSYGSGGFVGPAGDVFDFMKALDEKGLYKSNCLADAQLLAAKYSLNNRVNIPPPIIEWAASNTKISDVIADNNYYTLDGRDSMNHIMKGNIGLFLQQSYRVICNKLSIQNITNTSISENLDAGGCYGILFSGSKNVKLNNVNINNIKSDSGIALNIMYKNQNDTIDV